MKTSRAKTIQKHETIDKLITELIAQAEDIDLVTEIHKKYVEDFSTAVLVDMTIRLVIFSLVASKMISVEKVMEIENRMNGDLSEFTELENANALNVKIVITMYLEKLLGKEYFKNGEI